MIPVRVMVTRAFERPGLANAVVMSGMSVGQTRDDRRAGGGAGGDRLAFGVPLARHRPSGAGAAGALAIPPPPRRRSRRGQRRRRRSAGGAHAPVLASAGVYALCGFDDFFVTTHVVAFAQDRGLDAFLAGNLLALMGLTGLFGVMASGAWSDRSGPAWPTAVAFVARFAVFVLILVDQSTVSVTIFALVFGATFLVTAPLTVIFVVQSFGTKHLGALTGLIIMVHQMFGGIGAYLGAAVFDTTGSYDLAFSVMLAVSLLALLLTLLLGQPRRILAD